MWDINFLIPTITTNILISWIAWTWKTTLIKKLVSWKTLVSLDQYSTIEQIEQSYQTILQYKSWVVVLDEIESIVNRLTDEARDKLFKIIQMSFRNENNLKFVISTSKSNWEYETLCWIHVFASVKKEDNKLKYQKTVIFKSY